MTKRYHRYLYRPKDMIHFSAILLSGKGSFLFFNYYYYYFIEIFFTLFFAKTK